MVDRIIQEFVYFVEKEEKNLRLDVFVTEKLGADYSRSFAKKIIDTNNALVNGEAVKPSYRLREGEEILIKIPAIEELDIRPENIPLDILYEDDDIVVVNKSAGIVVHPGAGNFEGTLISGLLYHCKFLAEGSDSTRPGVVHRLDKNTSGVIVIAKNDKALRFLARQFQNREVRKIYIALVKGKVELDNGIINVPIGRHKGDRKKMAVDLEKGKEACTIYHVEKRFGDKVTLLNIELKTGRTHQIRVHMKHIGHPIIGDISYGGPNFMQRQALHSSELEFTHPTTGKKVKFKSELPEDMKNFIVSASSK